MTRKLIYTILSISICVLLMAACDVSVAPSKDGILEEKIESENSSELEHVTLRLYFPGNKRPETDEVWDRVEALTTDRLNASFEVNFIHWSDYKDKISLLIASGDNYDMNFDGHWFMYPNMVAKGAYMDLSELAPIYMPIYYDELKSRGHLASTMINREMLSIPWTPIYSMKPFYSFKEDEVGISYEKPIHTLEDLDEFITLVHEEFPEKQYVITTDAPLTQTGWMLYPKYELAKWDFHGFTFSLNDDTVQLVAIEQTEMFREIAKWNTKWVDDGIIPADALMNREKYFNLEDTLEIGQLNTMEYIFYNDYNHEEEFHFYEMYPGQKYLARSPLDNLTCINSNAANPERALMFLDILASDELVYDAVMYGIEGLTYTIDEEGTYQFPEGMSPESSNYMEWQGQWGLWRDRYMKPTDARTAEHYKVNKEFAAREEFVVSPIEGLFPNTDAIKNEIARRDAIFQEFALPILYGLVEDYETAIDDYIQMQNEVGTDLILQELQKQVDAYIADQK